MMVHAIEDTGFCNQKTGWMTNLSVSLRGAVTNPRHHEAVAHAHKVLSSNDIVEVWKENHLVTRLFQSARGTGVAYDTDVAD